ncbi:hypothetical protein TSOC_013178 [Tetrabaena socialis]|uniref:Ankyrin repeat domain-containing protein n=1 Tax=Tetrabaena socialis TaxID=47790 RepID=A0A2J7ZL26_9CHLO|nr:hypothetical protein TSOC_013178 [Tetrabaena socialis]|eukprot:PNH00963.1 hypothetical protein TSOC_013178 [Tetrabaena socialis]
MDGLQQLGEPRRMAPKDSGFTNVIPPHDDRSAPHTIVLSPNEVACILRLVNKATAAQFGGLQDRTVRLSSPVPHHAFVRRWGGVGAMRSLTRKQRSQLPCLTARSGSIANLEALLAGSDSFTRPLSTQVFQAAAGAGRLEVCRWLKQQGCPSDNFSMTAVAEGGHQAVCEWLNANECPWSGDAATAAACGGHAGLVGWLLAREIAEAFHWWGFCRGKRLRAVHSGVDGGHRHAQHGRIFKGVGSGIRCRQPPAGLALQAACAEAVQQPDGRARLEWLRQRGYPLSTAVAVQAAGSGAVGALELALDGGVTLAQGAMPSSGQRAALMAAAQGGHVAVLQALHARAYISSAGQQDMVAYEAAWNGHLSVVTWLAETLGAVAVLSARLFSYGAKSGSMELLAWLHENGCPWDHTVFVSAADAGCEEQLEWLAAHVWLPHGGRSRENGGPYAAAACNDDLATLRCLRRLGCPLGPGGEAFMRALEGQADSTKPALLWLLEQPNARQSAVGSLAIASALP